MSTCVRGGTTYKRHKYKKGVCKCGAVQHEQLRALRNRRARRKAEKTARKKGITNVCQEKACKINEALATEILS